MKTMWVEPWCYLFVKSLSKYAKTTYCFNWTSEKRIVYIVVSLSKVFFDQLMLINVNDLFRVCRAAVWIVYCLMILECILYVMVQHKLKIQHKLNRLLTANYLSLLVVGCTLKLYLDIKKICYQQNAKLKVLKKRTLTIIINKSTLERIWSM